MLPPTGYRPTFWERLGFRPAKRISSAGLHPRLTIATTLFFQDLTWAERLRLLVSGRLSAFVMIAGDTTMNTTQSWTNIGVLPPGGDR